MRILVIGGGAIGRMLLYKLSTSGHSVALVARPAMVEAIRNQASVVRTIESLNKLSIQYTYTFIADAFAANTQYDLIIIAVKSYDTASVAQELATCRGSLSESSILTVQNGIGNEETLSLELPGVRIIAGALTTPVEAVSPAEIHIMSDRFWIGLAEHAPHHGLTVHTQCAFAQAGFRVQVYTDHRFLKWSKLLMNILGNATSAIIGFSPDQVFANPHLGTLEIQMLREAIKVMRMRGISVVPIGGKPLPILTRIVRFTPAMVARKIVGRLVVKGRGGKMPSFYHDARRGKSEVKWLNGTVAREAELLGIPAPVNATLTEVLTGILCDSDLRTEFHGQPDRLLEEVDRHRLALSSRH